MSGPRPEPPGLDDVTLACVKFIGHTGARDFQLRWSDDQQPVVWIAVSVHGADSAQAAGGLTPREAVYRLVEVLVDGAVCAHCSRPTGVSDDFEGSMPAETLVCWYRFDPELREFRRGCEGDT